MLGRMEAFIVSIFRGISVQITLQSRTRRPAARYLYVRTTLSGCTDNAPVPDPQNGALSICIDSSSPLCPLSFLPTSFFLLSSFFSPRIGLGWNLDETHRAGPMNLRRFQLPVSGRNRVGRVTQTDEPLTPLAWVYSNPGSPGHWPNVFIPLALPSPFFLPLSLLLSPPEKYIPPSIPHANIYPNKPYEHSDPR